MNKINIGLIGYGNVGSGVIKFLSKKRGYIADKYKIEFNIKSICDLRFENSQPPELAGIKLTTNFKDIVNDPQVDIVIELIGGLHPAREIVSAAIKKGKHIVTANKGLIAQYGRELFKLSEKYKSKLYFESSVMAGVPIIKTLTEGVAGNQFNRFFGIINGTCNYILSAMAKHDYSFEHAVKEAQKNGYAETDPTLDISGMDSAYKLAILVSLSMEKFITVKDIHTEGITEITRDDIQFASDLGLSIKLLAIAKKINNEIEVRVHPTLIPKDHPLASINGVLNAMYMNIDPLGDILLSGEGAGQSAAASGIVSDLINMTASQDGSAMSTLLSNICRKKPTAKLKKIDDIASRFYLRFMATDKPGVLSKIAGVLGKYGIGINSVSQKIHNRAATVPVIMITEPAPGRMVRLALKRIHKMPVLKSKPVAIRMEKLK